MTGGYVEPRDLGGLLLEEQRYHPRDGHGPDGQTGKGSPPQSTPGERLHGVYHSQEPVNADDRHEHDRGIHVTVERSGDEAAHGRPESPVTSGKVVADLKREHRHKEHVCHGQVQHVHHGGLLDLHLQGEHDDGHDVQRKAYEEHAGVHGGDKERQPGAGQIS